MDILAKCDKIYSTGICRTGNFSAENVFALYYILKIETLRTSWRSYKYISGKENRDWPKGPRDIKKGEI